MGGMGTGITTVVEWQVKKWIRSGDLNHGEFELTHTERTVLMVLAGYADNQSRTCNPSSHTIARDLALSRSTVFRAFQKLESLRIIERRNKFKNNEQVPNEYVVFTPDWTVTDDKPGAASDHPVTMRSKPNRDGVSQCDPVAEETGCHSDTGRGVTVTLGGCHSDTQNYPINYPENCSNVNLFPELEKDSEPEQKSLSREKKTDPVRIPWKKIKETWTTVCVGTDLDDIEDIVGDRKRSLSARYKKWGEEKFFEVLTSPLTSTFLSGRGPNMKGYDKPFRPTIDWLMKEGNFVKVLEGKYKDREKAEVQLEGKHHAIG